MGHGDSPSSFLWPGCRLTARRLVQILPAQPLSAHLWAPGRTPPPAWLLAEGRLSWGPIGGTLGSAFSLGRACVWGVGKGMVPSSLLTPTLLPWVGTALLRVPLGRRLSLAWPMGPSGPWRAKTAAGLDSVGLAQPASSQPGCHLAGPLLAGAGDTLVSSPRAAPSTLPPTTSSWA